MKTGWRDFFKIACAILLCFVCTAAFADYDPWGVPDSSEIRKSLRERWFTAPLSTVRTYAPEIYESKAGNSYQVRFEERGSEVLIIVSPAQDILIDMYNGSEKQDTVTGVSFPENSAGSWVLYRSAKNGKPIRIRYYFLATSDIFLEFNAVGKKTTADFVLFNMYAAKGVPLGVKFERLYLTSFPELRKLTKNSLPWYLAAAEPSMYHSNLQMISVIRENLERIESVADGAYDELGNPVGVISGEPRELLDGEDENKLQLSEAGFLKWIVDGVVAATAKGYTYMKPLYRPTVNLPNGGHSDVFSQEYNITFSLDWTRNLALALLSVQKDKNYEYENSGVDVAISPFNSGRISGKDVPANAVGYVKNAGYRIDVLKALLYVLAVTESDRAYLAAVREPQVSEKNDSTYPEVGVFNDCAIFLPYFDRNGAFACAVFQDGKEISLDKFVEKYKGAFVNLVRLQSSDRFFPLEAGKNGNGQ